MWLNASGSDQNAPTDQDEYHDIDINLHREHIYVGLRLAGIMEQIHPSTRAIFTMREGNSLARKHKERFEQAT